MNASSWLFPPLGCHQATVSAPNNPQALPAACTHLLATLRAVLGPSGRPCSGNFALSQASRAAMQRQLNLQASTSSGVCNAGSAWCRPVPFSSGKVQCQGRRCQLQVCFLQRKEEWVCMRKGAMQCIVRRCHQQTIEHILARASVAVAAGDGHRALVPRWVRHALCWPLPPNPNCHRTHYEHFDGEHDLDDARDLVLEACSCGLPGRHLTGTGDTIDGGRRACSRRMRWALVASPLNGIVHT